MKTLGIIAEYNPFHKGHKYHLDKSLEATGADCAVAVMSGNFTQRGEISPWDKWTRSQYAVLAGVNLVVELPFVYACNQGEEFAKGAVDILASMGIDFISFGSEVGDISALENLVEQMDEKATEIDAACQALMADGNSFAKSQTEAVSQVLGEDLAAILGEPNNILALKYIKRIKYHNDNGANITPITIQRHGSGYFESNIVSGFAGASEIRELVENGDFEAASGYMPPKTKPMLTDGCPWMNEAKDRMLRLIQADAIRLPADTFSDIYCMGEGLENKITKEALKAQSYDELMTNLTSKRYPTSVMRRVSLYMMMRLSGEELPQGKYLRVLAADKKGRDVLRAVKDMEDGPAIVTNVNKELNLDDQSKESLKIDIMASDLYNLVCGCDLQEWSDRKYTPFIKSDDL